MSDIGINFRASAGYVTDGAGQTYCLGDAYPTTRGGATFGWEDGGTSTRDRSNVVDARLAGINFAAATAGVRFRLDLPATGSWTVHYAGADPLGSALPGNWAVKDNTATLFSLTNTGSGSNFQDATGSFYSSAAWPGSEAGRAVTVSTGPLRAVTTAADSSAIAHLRAVSASPPPPSGGQDLVPQAACLGANLLGNGTLVSA